MPLPGHKKARHMAGLFVSQGASPLHELLQQDTAVLYEERYEDERQNGR